MLNLKRMLKDRRAASAAEYALLLAIIGAGLAVAALKLGQAITDAITAVGTTIASSV
jgi:pilus assembly protein Flp/PilA